MNPVGQICFTIMVGGSTQDSVTASRSISHKICLFFIGGLQNVPRCRGDICIHSIRMVFVEIRRLI